MDCLGANFALELFSDSQKSVEQNQSIVEEQQLHPAKFMKRKTIYLISDTCPWNFCIPYMFAFAVVAQETRPAATPSL
jgi:hypothetical protein